MKNDHTSYIVFLIPVIWIKIFFLVFKMLCGSTLSTMYFYYSTSIPVYFHFIPFQIVYFSFCLSRLFPWH